MPQFFTVDTEVLKISFCGSPYRKERASRAKLDVDSIPGKGSFGFRGMFGLFFIGKVL